MKDLQEQFDLLRNNVDGWNQWRSSNNSIEVNFSQVTLRKADLVGANLSNVNLSRANLYGAYLSKASLCNANLSMASFIKADLSDADLTNANLSHCVLQRANLLRAKFHKANLYHADLIKADLSKAILTDADLTEANLQYSILVETIISETILTNCRVYGLSAWNLIGIPKDQSGLIITTDNEAKLTVDDLQLAQFIYLLLNNQNVRNVIDTMTSKVVLILGNFAKDRKVVLDAIKNDLRGLNFTPILFEFNKPASKDVTGTVETIARMARFIIADITDPRSIPHELASLVPHLRTTPIQLIQLEGSDSYSMISDYYRSYNWILKPFKYKDTASLIRELPAVIAPANEMAEGFRKQ